MAVKRATFLTFGNDAQCSEVKQFIEENGVLLDVRDLEQQPMNERELGLLIGYFNVSHFVNPFSMEFEKHGLDKGFPSRDEVIKLLAEEPALLRRPIIQTGRLMTIGCNRQRITEMLQLSENGNRAGDDNDSRRNQRQGGQRHRQAVNSR